MMIANEVRFEPITYSQKEGADQDVILTLTGNTSYPVQEVTQIRIRDVSSSAEGIFFLRLNTMVYCCKIILFTF